MELQRARLNASTCMNESSPYYHFLDNHVFRDINGKSDEPERTILLDGFCEREISSKMPETRLPLGMNGYRLIDKMIYDVMIQEAMRRENSYFSKKAETVDCYLITSVSSDLPLPAFYFFCQSINSS